MKASLATALIVLLFGALATSESTRVASLETQGQLLGTIVLIPWLGLLAAFMLVQANAPRRLFDEQSRPLARFTLGLGSGALTGVLSMVGLTLLESGVSEQLTVGLSGLCAGLLCALPLTRVTPRSCRGCGYDMRGLGHATCCPECGTETLHPAARQRHAGDAHA